MGEVAELLEEWPEFDQIAKAVPVVGTQVVPGFTDVAGLLGPGIYALLRWNEIVYIGKAKVLLTRIYSHKNALERKRKGKSIPAIPFSRVVIRPCSASDLDRLEGEMIRKYRPRYNERMVPKPERVPGLKIDLVALGLIKPKLPAMDRRGL